MLAAHGAVEVTPKQVKEMVFQLGITGKYEWYWYAYFALRYHTVEQSQGKSALFNAHCGEGQLSTCPRNVVRMNRQT